MHIKIIDGQPETYTIGQLRRDNPNVSFPKDIPAETLEAFAVYRVNELPRPQIDERTHYIKASDFYQVDGNWQMRYHAEPLPQAQVEQVMREARDSLLAATDWVVVKSYERGEPVPAEWAEYRQALRDIPLRENFPYSVQWPTPPGEPD